MRSEACDDEIEIGQNPIANALLEAMLSKRSLLGLLRGRLREGKKIYLLCDEVGCRCQPRLGEITLRSGANQDRRRVL